MCGDDYREGATKPCAVCVSIPHPVVRPPGPPWAPGTLSHVTLSAEVLSLLPMGQCTRRSLTQFQRMGSLTPLSLSGHYPKALPVSDKMARMTPLPELSEALCFHPIFIQHFSPS